MLFTQYRRLCGLLAILLSPLAAQSQKQSEPLRFLGNASLPPMTSLHEGRPEGVVVDLAYAVAGKAGLSVKIEAMDWPEAQQLVAAGKADALLQINPTPERQTLFDFSDILLDSNFHIFRRIDRGNIHGLDSLKGRKVGVESGGFSIQYLKQHDEIDVIVVPSWEAAFKMLHDGQLDAVFVDRWAGEYELYLHQLSDIVRVDPPVVTDHSRIAVKKGNAKLLERINFGLREIARDGTRQAIVNRWQGKEVVYLTRESIRRWGVGGIIAIAVLLFAVVYARVVKQRNISLQQKVEAQGRLRLFIEHAPAALAMFDRQMRYVSVSQRWLEDYGLSGQNLLGRSHYEVFPEASERWKEFHRRGLAGEVLRKEADRFERVDGRVQWLHWEIRPWHDAAGVVGGIVIFTEDITERRQAEEALRHSEERWSTTLQSIGDAVISTCAQGKIVFMNEVAEKLTGWSLSEAQGRDLEAVFDIVQEVTRIKPENPVSKVLRFGKVISLANHTLLIQRDGTEVPIEDSAAPIRNAAGDIEGVVLVFHDVSEQRMAEAALLRSEKLASVGRMAATIAHEINNPLASVTNLLFLARTADGLPEPAGRYLETADEELKRVTHITRQSLGFYRETNRPTPASVTAILDSAIEVLQSRIKAKSAVIERKWDGDVHVTAVAGELRQVFSNLLANSLDAIDENGVVKFRVSTGPAAKNGECCVRVTIADNGKGISAAKRPHIFEPFFTTKGAIGTGLGLWVSKRIVDSHGGAIRVRSSTDGSRRGTVVLVVLPVEGTAAAHGQSAGA